MTAISAPAGWTSEPMTGGRPDARRSAGTPTRSSPRARRCPTDREPHRGRLRDRPRRIRTRGRGRRVWTAGSRWSDWTPDGSARARRGATAASSRPPPGSATPGRRRPGEWPQLAAFHAAASAEIDSLATILGSAGGAQDRRSTAGRGAVGERVAVESDASTAGDTGAGWAAHRGRRMGRRRRTIASPRRPRRHGGGL